jgi:hypothetical protein
MRWREGRYWRICKIFKKLVWNVSLQCKNTHRDRMRETTINYIGITSNSSSENGNEDVQNTNIDSHKSCPLQLEF